MDIITCPKCSTRVAISPDGTCPSCREPLDYPCAPRSDADPQPISAAPRNGDSTSESRIHAAVKSEQLVNDQPTHFDLLWILLSLSGRIPRVIFWTASILVPLLCLVIIGIANSALPDSLIVSLVGLLSLFAMFWSSLAVGVKRLHDLGMSGWWILMGFFPGIGPVFMFIFAGLLRGTRGPNRFGVTPPWDAFPY